MKSAPRVLMVSEPGCYGVFMYVRSLIRFLHARHSEWIVDLAYSSRRGSPELEPLVREVEAHGGEAIDLRVGNFPEPGDIFAAGKIVSLAARRRPAVVHAHSSKAGALVRLLALAPGFPPVIYTPHGYYGMSRRGGKKDAVFNGIETVLGFIGWTHNVSIHEREFALRHLSVPSDRALLIFAGIDLERFCPPSTAEKMAARRALGLPETGRLLVTVGRDAYEKNYGDLYAALDRVLPAADWNFAHAGAGSVELREKLSPPARERAFAIPFLDRPEMLYRAADGFALVSRSEAFGLAAYEALACGLPLLLTATSGLLSLRTLDFSGIRWLPGPADHGDISAEIAAAMNAWATESPGDPSAQRAKFRSWFDAGAQFEKLARVYGHFANGEAGDPRDDADRVPNLFSSPAADATVSR